MSTNNNNYSSPTNMPNNIPDPSLSGKAFNDLLTNRGVAFIHHKATMCPNINSLVDNSHDPLCQFCDGNGILYYQQVPITGVWSSNHVEKQFESQGIWDIGSAVVTFPTEYSDGSPAEFNTFDKLTIPDHQVRVWELKEYEPRPQQQLRYPVITVDYLATITNNTLKTYTSQTDFNIVDGKIEWLNPPDYNSVTERGDVFTVNYYCHPEYQVLQHLKELRVTQHFVDGVKQPLRLPQSLLVKRSFLPQANEKDV